MSIRGQLMQNRSFDDFDHLTDQARHWDLDFRQLDRGPFHGHLLQFRTEHSMIARARFGRQLHQEGSSPEGMRTFALFAKTGQELLWRGQKVGPNEVLIFPKNGELDSVSQADFDMFTFSICESLLVEICESLQADSLFDILESTSLQSCSTETMKPLQKALHRVCRETSSNPNCLRNPLFIRECEKEITNQIITALTLRVTCGEKPPLRLRDIAMKRALDHIVHFGHTNPSIGELCEVATVSERTLEYAFLEYLGVSPKYYLLAYRLNGVRKQLRDARSEAATKIVQVANEWGFWHMGQFANHYRRLFDELPSETLNHPKKDFQSR